MCTPWALGISLHTIASFQSANLQQEQDASKQTLWVKAFKAFSFPELQWIIHNTQLLSFLTVFFFGAGGEEADGGCILLISGVYIFLYS